MSVSNRTVENGGTFSNTLIKIARQEMAVIKGSTLVVCPSCNCRPARTVDHTIPWTWNGTNEHFNLGLLCSKCHTEKSKAEVEIDEIANWQTVLAARELHIAKWLHLQFDKKNMRRRPQLSKRAQKLKSVQRINRIECDIRQEDSPHRHYAMHSQKAKIHRQVRQRREFRKGRA